jgi:Icc-related predicted phosphoesterase
MIEEEKTKSENPNFKLKAVADFWMEITIFTFPLINVDTGHIHDAYGIQETGDTTFVNAALVDEEYRLLNKPFELEI